MPLESLIGAVVIVAIFVTLGVTLAWADWNSRRPPKQRDGP
jgi:hypothetical protein